jgi:hypothetical protein
MVVDRICCRWVEFSGRKVAMLIPYDQILANVPPAFIEYFTLPHTLRWTP